MDQPSTQQWYLRKHEDHIIFGPLSFEQLALWASTAQVAPHDAISTDQLTWMKAPMLPQLGMDWLVEVTSERYYGPTTWRQIQELPGLELLPEPVATETEPGEAQIPTEPAATGISIDVQDRIRDLEQ